MTKTEFRNMTKEQIHDYIFRLKAAYKSLDGAIGYASLDCQGERIAIMDKIEWLKNEYKEKYSKPYVGV